MRIPFFNKHIKVEITDAPKTTRLGLVEGTPITQSSFKKVKDRFDQFYIDRVEQNKEIFEGKLAKANEWVEFVKGLIKDIPKDNISCIYIKNEPQNDMESISSPRVYLAIEYISSPGCSSYRQYEIFSNEHENSERSINDILEDVKKFKKEIQHDDSKNKTKEK